LGLGDETFSYNEKSELVQVIRVDGLVAKCAYDPTGQRPSKQVTAKDGAITTTLFAGAEVEIRNGTVLHYVMLGAGRTGFEGLDLIRNREGIHADGYHRATTRLLSVRMILFHQ
jgi:hypothetical protein